MPTDRGVGAPAPAELRSVRGYERTTLDRCIADLEAERDRLLSSVRSAEAERAGLDPVQPISETEHVGAIVLDARARLTAEWDACRQNEAALEEATEAVAAWILAAAHSHATSLRAVVAGIQPRRTGEPAENWWQSVIDLTADDAERSARSA